MLCPGELSGSEGSLRERVEELRAALAELDAERDQMQAVADTRAQECAQLQERVEAMVGIGQNVGCCGGCLVTWLLVCLVVADAGESWPSCLCSKAGGQCKVREGDRVAC